MLLDFAVKTGRETFFFALAAKPGASQLLLKPQRFYKQSGLVRPLGLTSTGAPFNENVNQGFISNSFLYLAISSPHCRVSIVRYLLDLGCPLLNEKLPVDHHDFHPFFQLLRRTRNFDYTMRVYELSPGALYREEGLLLTLLGSAMLQKQYQAYARELAIGIEMSVDPDHCRKQAVVRSSYMKNARLHPELLRVVLPSNQLFGTCFSFAGDQLAFWKKKTYELFFHTAMLGLHSEMKESIEQFHSFVKPTQPVPLQLAEVTGLDELLEGSEVLAEEKYRIYHSGADVLSHFNSLHDLLLRSYFVRVQSTHNLTWLDTALRQVSSLPELFVRGSHQDKQQLLSLKKFFEAFKAFHRHTNTTLLHYLVKYPELLSDAKTLLESPAKKFAHCLDSKGRSPLSNASRAANLPAVQLLLDFGVPFSPEAQSPFFYALQGPARLLTRPLGSEEESTRMRVFEELLARLPGQTPTEGDDTSGYDGNFSTEKTLMHGPAASFGYPLILACARYSEASVRKLLSLNVAPCLVHEQEAQQKRRGADKKIVVTTVLVKTCALKEALKRKDVELAQIIARKLATDFPLTVQKQQ